MRGPPDRRDQAAADSTSRGDGVGAKHARWLRTRLLVAIGFGTALTAAAWVLLAHHYSSYPGTPVYGYWREGAIGTTIFLPVATTLALRRPDHRVTWVFAAVAVVGGVQDLLGVYGNYVIFARPGELPFGVEAAAVSSAAQATFVCALILLIALFPTGRALTRRWRVVPGGALAAAVAVPFTIVLNERPWPDDEALADVVNPLAPAFGDIAVQIAGGVVALGLAVGLLGGLAQLIVRYRRAATDERLQIKLFTMFAVAAPILLFVPHPLHDLDPGWVLWTVVPSSLPVAIAIAIVKHRLYGVDVVISRTVVFAGLAAFITAIYVGIVVGIGTLLGAGGEPNLALSIVATAVVAVAFQPVRERLTRLANRLVFGKRATPYEVLSTFSSHLGDTVATEDTLQRMARLLADGTGAAHAQVSLAIGGQMVPAANVGQVDPSSDAHTVEVSHQGETLGALSVTKKRGETLTPADTKLVDDLAAQAGLLLRNVRLTEELKAKIVALRASRQRLVAAQDQERRRLERDLHDGAQQQIVAMKLKLGIARTLAEREGAPQTIALVEQLTEQTDDCVQTLRELAHGIYPPLLAAEGLHAAITTAARRAPVPVTVEAEGIGRYGQDIEAAVYFCVLEAITNATKYANPTHITVRLAQTDHLTFEVSDDGTGFDPGTTPTGHGLTNMTDRLDALEGHLHITSQPGAGTSIRGTLEVVADEEATQPS